jgi:hypothetical protein
MVKYPALFLRLWLSQGILFSTGLIARAELSDYSCRNPSGLFTDINIKLNI